ncbi:MAG: cupin domain-containing protein [Gammaproteobacteria bacterium]|nr:cupin domain-containing protein [Gammaproteobacteria bacterium]MDD9897001.1 cupin domain-containing protein [Gammaproteobacteria bacterium]MDD9959083.1 cupin domain-containing protein [Gammaproteobacteria bacterium]
MKKILISLSFILSATALVWAQDSMPPAQYFYADDIGTDLAASLSQRPFLGIGVISVGEDYNIHMIRRNEPAGAIVHPDGTELHYIVEGAGILTTGGIAVRPESGGAASIEGGYSQRVTVGDLVLIPRGTPHQYTAVEGVVGYLEVRFRTEEY